MGGGLLQLVAYGAQDVYLTGNPQITFFKVVYRRHTNFSMESISQTFNGVFDFGKTVTAQISRNGDLINRMYLEVELDAVSNMPGFDTEGGNDAVRYVNYIGLRLLKNISLEIGGQQIDKQYSNWLYIWNELALAPGKRYGWDVMVGADNDVTSFKPSTLFIPLEFWFCRNIGLSLPLIALQYHEVKVKVELEEFSKCVYNGSAVDNSTLGASVSGALTNKIKNGVLWVDYIFLDTDERRRFAQMSHEYLIEQIQFTGEENISETSYNKVKLNFNHPVKELVWVCRDESNAETSQWYNYTDTTSNINKSDFSSLAAMFGGITGITDSTADSNIASNIVQSVVYGINPAGENIVQDAILQLNGNDRFSERKGSYFNLVQPFQHHTNIPKNSGINVYSFALKPEEHQPSGTLNMSRIDSAVLNVKGSKASTMWVYAINYNVLRILSGMGGLAYSN
jgi:hypothetical protein